MSGLSNIAIRFLAAGVLLALPAGAFAQLDARAVLRAQQRGEETSLYGTNPYENDSETEGEPQDTTQKVRRIRKPLESYFFDDSIRALPNFKWHIRQDYNRVTVCLSLSNSG